MLLSSLHHDDSILDNENRKPQIIVDYNAHKSGVDTLDQLVRCYSSKRKTNRWPFALFCNLLDIGAYNAFVLFLGVNPDFQSQTSHRRRIFLVDLATALLQLPAEITAPTRTSANNNSIPGPSNSKGRCKICPRSRDKKIRQKCTMCNKFVCSDHSNNVCLECLPSVQ